MPDISVTPERHLRKKILLAVGSIVGLSVLLVGLLLWAKFPKRLPRTEPRLGPPSIETTPRPSEDPVSDDRDRDGLTNEEEVTLGTSQTAFDTDYDGLSDIDEIRSWETDPLKFDTDGDGFGDGVEAIRGFNPKGPGKL